MRIPHPRGDAILAHWAARAGISVEAFSHEGISVISWNARKQRVLIYRTDSDAVILAPEPLADCGVAPIPWTVQCFRFGP